MHVDGEWRAPEGLGSLVAVGDDAAVYNLVCCLQFPFSKIFLLVFPFYSVVSFFWFVAVDKSSQTP